MTRLHQEHGDEELVAVAAHAQRLPDDALLDHPAVERDLHQLVEQRDVAHDALERGAHRRRRATGELEEAIRAARDRLRDVHAEERIARLDFGRVEERVQPHERQHHLGVALGRLRQAEARDEPVGVAARAPHQLERRADELRAHGRHAERISTTRGLRRADRRLDRDEHPAGENAGATGGVERGLSALEERGFGALVVLPVAALRLGERIVTSRPASRIIWAQLSTVPCHGMKQCSLSGLMSCTICSSV